MNLSVTFNHYSEPDEARYNNQLAATVDAVSLVVISSLTVKSEENILDQKGSELFAKKISEKHKEIVGEDVSVSVFDGGYVESDQEITNEQAEQDYRDVVGRYFNLSSKLGLTRFGVAAEVGGKQAKIERPAKKLMLYLDRK